MKLKYTRWQLVFEILSLVCILGISIWLLVSWSQIPDQIPSHYNFAGEVDKYGGKGSLLVLYFIMLGIYLVLTLVSRFPQVWNMPVTITPQNQAYLYRVTFGLLSCIKMQEVLLFSFLLYTSALGKTLGGAFLWIVLITVFGTIIVAIYKMTTYTKKMR